MLIRFESQVFLTDDNVARAFTTLLNYMAISTSERELSRYLRVMEQLPPKLNPGSYFVWEFEDMVFRVQQRLTFRSAQLFSSRLLTLLLYMPPQSHNKID